MKKMKGSTRAEVRRICRDIYSQREKLKTLLVRLQEVVGQEVRTDRRDTPQMRTQSDDPFDKIMVA